jgi:uncharacterized tellurite resistance protein B-like protein
MLTEGFDDPKVQTVFIARLTLSTNRFWQMIGRGTRGPAAGGTLTCNVLDPIKLFRLYDYAAGYQPTLANPDAIELEESISKDADPESNVLRKPDLVEVSECYPLPSTIPYSIDPMVSQRMTSVAQVLHDFLRHSIPPDSGLLEVAKAVKVELDDQGSRFVPAESPEPAMANLILHEVIHRLAEALNTDLNWLHRRIPPNPAPADTAEWLQQIGRVRSVPIRTENHFDSPTSFSQAGHIPGPAPVPATVPSKVSHEERALALITTCLHLAQVDGQIDPNEVEVSIRAVTEHTGVPNGPLLREAFQNSVRRDLATALDQLKSESDSAAAKRLLRSWVAVARADQPIHPAEIELLQRWTAHMGISNDFLEGMLAA